MREDISKSLQEAITAAGLVVMSKDALQAKEDGVYSDGELLDDVSDLLNGYIEVLKKDCDELTEKVCRLSDENAELKNIIVGLSKLYLQYAKNDIAGRIERGME